ncbi:MAG: hypothetical protein CMB02_03515 [Euryarchaeota archaeon]|nr:hypothetical protein [Euryarchaeota archaeon]
MVGEKEEQDKIPRHLPPKGSDTSSQELLYDTNIPTPSHSEHARTMVSTIGTGTLCTLSTDPDGYPYGSFVTFALHENEPIFLISALAEHTKNLQVSPESSLLIAEAGEGNPLALGRTTLIGKCEKMAESERESAKSVFVQTHPDASFYADFKDFFFYKLEVQSARYIGGFGRMSWITGDDWKSAEPDPLAESAAGIIEHMNDDHRDAMVVCCTRLSRAKDTSDAFMTGIDKYGFEMSAITDEGPRPIRLAFDRHATTSEEARKEIVKLVKKARNMVD